MSAGTPKIQDPPYGMRQPAEWSALLGRSAELAQADPAMPPGQTVDFLQSLREMRDNTIARCRYYGLGLAAVKLDYRAVPRKIENYVIPSEYGF